jgi:hypothetical protein
MRGGTYFPQVKQGDLSTSRVPQCGELSRCSKCLRSTQNLVCVSMKFDCQESGRYALRKHKSRKWKKDPTKGCRVVQYCDAQSHVPREIGTLQHHISRTYVPRPTKHGRKHGARKKTCSDLPNIDRPSDGHTKNLTSAQIIRPCLTMLR